MNFRSARFGRVPPGVSMLLIAAFGALLTAACGSTTVASVVRANAITVDGTSISRKDFEHDLSALASNKKFQALDKSVAAQGGTGQRLFTTDGHPTRVLTTSWLNRLANQIVIDEEFKQLHLTISAADKTEGANQFAQLFATQSAPGTDLVKDFPAWFRTQETAREARLVAVTRSIEAKHPITEAQMRDYYTKNVGSLCPSGVNVSHILVKTLPEAQAIEAQLKAGAKFSDLATAKSIDTASAQKGGSLGCFATGPVRLPRHPHVEVRAADVRVAEDADSSEPRAGAEPPPEVRQCRAEEGQRARRPAVRHLEHQDLPRRPAQGAGGPELEKRDDHDVVSWRP
jgi:PPIC-type PPIASE domain